MTAGTTAAAGPKIAPRPGDGALALLAWVLADEARTRRLRSVLVLVLPAAVLVAVSLAVMVVLSPLAGATVGGAAIGGGLGVLAGPAMVAARRRRADPRP